MVLEYFTALSIFSIPGCWLSWWAFHQGTAKRYRDTPRVAIFGKESCDVTLAHSSVTEVMVGLLSQLLLVDVFLLLIWKHHCVPCMLLKNLFHKLETCFSSTWIHQKISLHLPLHGIYIGCRCWSIWSFSTQVCLGESSQPRTNATNRPTDMGKMPSGDSTRFILLSSLVFLGVPGVGVPWVGIKVPSSEVGNKKNDKRVGKGDY